LLLFFKKEVLTSFDGRRRRAGHAKAGGVKMAGSVNKVILIGNLGRDPEARTMQSGGKVVSFSIATSESWNDKMSGERKEKTQWHRIVIFDERLGEVAEKYLKKGAKVYIEGSLESRKYTDKDGNERETTEVVLQRFRGALTMLDGRGDSSSGSEGYSRDRPSSGGASRPAARSGGGAAPSWEPAAGGDLDDEIPF
jgi:single-strand DNA-binding protein